MKRRIGNYDVICELGAGQFGTVYLAHGGVGAAASVSMVAIKQLHDRRKSGALDELRREFELLEQARHRSICKVYEFLEHEGALFQCSVIQSMTAHSMRSRHASRRCSKQLCSSLSNPF